MQRWVERVVEHPVTWWLACAAMALMFVVSGLAKVLVWDISVAEVAAAGLQPAALYTLASAVVLLVGSALLFTVRWVWLGAGALAVFLVLTILLVHRFWALEGAAAQTALLMTLEHLSVIGGLMALAVAGQLRQRGSVRRDAEVQR
ncbi:DoxX family protein [Isoalcanivorax beigongshangi]|uniref:DoxX family protein n=1 Tax=Isoalcanivorax beigongshangi TaxID=3238810 RepID=A0ABV4ADK0_9GAMM